MPNFFKVLICCAWLTFAFSCQIPQAQKAEQFTAELAVILGEGKPKEALDLIHAMEESLPNGDALTEQKNWPIELEIFHGYSALDEFDAGIPWLLASIQHVNALHGPDSHEALSVSAAYGYYLRRIDQATDARFHLEPIVLKLTAGWGTEDRGTIDACSELADVYRDLELPTKALPLHRQVLEQDRRLLGNSNIRTARAGRNLAVTLIHLEQYEEAEPLIIEAVATFKSVSGPYSPETFEARMIISYLHFLTQRFQQSLDGFHLLEKEMLNTYGEGAEGLSMIREFIRSLERTLGQQTEDL
jgi:tetratricopeptide (TPR) repeat protein